MDNKQSAKYSSSPSGDSRGKRSNRDEKSKREEVVDQHDDVFIKARAKDNKEKVGRSSRSSEDVVPGAYSSTGEHKSRKSGKRFQDRTPRSPIKSDEKSARRITHAGASTNGDKKEITSPRSSRNKRGEKDKERRESRATKPGVEYSTSSRDRTRNKSSGRSKNKDIASESLPYIGDDDGDPLVAAVTVEKEHEVQGAENYQAQAHTNDMQAEQDMGLREAERQEKKRKAKKRIIIIVAAVVLVLIGGGVATYFAIQGFSSSNKVKQNTGQQPESENSDPFSMDPSTSPMFHPSSDPSNAPTSLQLKYDQPSLEECELIAAGLPISGEDEMIDRNFGISMEVDINDGSDIVSLVPDLQTKIEKLFVPDLIGCPRDVFATKNTGRGLTHHTMGKNASSAESDPRRLQSAYIRYAIAKATVIAAVTDDDFCEKSTSPNCSVVIANLDLKVRGEEKIIYLAGVIGETFPNGKDIRPDLELDAPFRAVVIGIIRPLDPTLAPTIAPTGVASENPTTVPTSSLSTSPTFAPVSGPTTPTKSPSKPLSKAPTLPPSLAPTRTPPPTFAPQPGLTPPPTPPPTTTPTNFPSSSSPSTNPTLLPSATPSVEASSAPSLAPTNGPTSGPSLSPITTAPTSAYLGCFQDDDTNRVPEVLASGILDVEGCREFCRTIEYPYSAIQDGNECWCGNNYDTLGPSSNCNSQCLDSDADQHCGGPLSNSVYFSGAPLTAVVPALENDLYCGCMTDSIQRDLPHLSPNQYISQASCIHYCKSQGYDFAGLQNVKECWCGNNPGAHGMSLNCFFVDKGRDGVIDRCPYNEVAAACYGGTTGCHCGGPFANTLFRTSRAVSCPAAIPPTQDYLGCWKDIPSKRDLSVLGTFSATIVDCKNICKDIGFVYSSIQTGEHCFCGNSYGNHGGTHDCISDCIVDSSESRCGGLISSSVYWSGAAVAPVADLEENLYCRCTRDSAGDRRDLEHLAPYDDLGQKACILYCRTRGYDFAGLQSKSQCFCGNDPGAHSFSESCDMDCEAQEASNCYDGSSSCTCGGVLANDLFRTSASVSCPEVATDSYTYIGCFEDDANRVFDTLAIRDLVIPSCVALCREMGFAFAGLQDGIECFCGNQYNSLGTSTNCGASCLDGDGPCGGDLANSVYATGATSSVSVLEDDLYCGCTADTQPSQLPHLSPYSELSQTGCIYYCKSKGYDFAGLQNASECRCGDSAESQGASTGCNSQCSITDAGAGCYGGTSSCSCGGDANVNSLFRTSTLVTCPPA